MIPLINSHRKIISHLSVFLLYANISHLSLSFIINTNLSSVHHRARHSSIATAGQLHMASYGRSTPRYTKNTDRSKRQERVGQLIRSEIATVIHQGYVKNTDGDLDEDLRRRINVVNADVSPDLKQARITVSVIKPHTRNFMDSEDDYDDEEEEGEDDDYNIGNRNGDAVVDSRRAYSWLVKNSKQIRYSIAQRLSHMKSIPNIMFVQVDVGAAVDVMNLIEKVANGYKRDYVGQFGQNDDELPTGMYLESELDDEDWDDEEDWIDNDDDESENEEDSKISSIEEL